MKITKSYLKQIIKEELSRFEEGEVIDAADRFKQAGGRPAEEPSDSFVNPNEMKTAKRKKEILDAYGKMGDKLGQLYKPYFDQPPEKREQGEGAIKYDQIWDIVDAAQAEIWPNESLMSRLDVKYGADFQEKCRNAFNSAASQHLTFLSKQGTKKVRVQAIEQILKAVEERLNKTGYEHILSKKYPDKAPPIYHQMNKFRASLDRQQRAADKRQRDI